MKKIFTLCVVLCLSYLSMGATNLKHEFRATWLATVSGIDWPETEATNDATREQQKQELIDILDKMKAGNLNAVCFQVRSLCDAMYQSSYEPWSVALTGTRGKDPGYDPLQFAIDEAHKRGMELHVWVNPFRASTSTLAATDMLWDNAGDWLIKYNNSSFSGYLIDPGYPESRAYVVKVLMEIINNYDVDGLVMDDYFYAYGGTTNQDSVAQALHYRASEVIDVNNNGNKIDDWRRSNVDNVIKAMYDSIQVVKPWVRFGMGPGGIWSMDKNAANAYGLTLPSGIRGSDPYTELYCNTVEWVKQGWVDYVNPQIYWSTQVAAQDYDVLCQWWSKDVCEHFSNLLPNGKKVHHFPSPAAYKVYGDYSGYEDGVEEMKREMDANRANLSSGYTGAVFYNTTSYLQMSEELAASHFTHTALAPPMEWKVKGDLAAPTNLQLSGTTLSWQHATAERFTVYAYPKGIGVNTATSNPQYLQAVVYDKSFNTSSIGSLDDITIAVYTYDRYGVEHGVALYNADPNATDDPEPEPEPEPEPSNTITWELNGGEVNTVTVEVPTQSGLMLQFMNDYVAYFGTPTIDVDAFHPTGNMTGFLYRGKNTREKSVNEMILDETAGWKWLADYIISTSASNPTIVAALNSGTEVNWRYSIAAFFEQNGSGTYNVDFSTAGQPAAWGSTYQVAHGMVLLPTYVTSAYTLPTPTHPEGLTFLGWYDNPAFSGSSLTIIPAHWTGTLYAQWRENAPTIDPTWQILYTSTNGNIVTPYKTDVFGANIVSNTYENGVGTITFDGPVTSIGDYAFWGCSSLTSITIPNSVTSIGGYAFTYCSSLTSITIPNSVTSIGGYAFYECSRLTSITIPNSVTSIGDDAFYGCKALTSIIIPNSVTSIGESAFKRCSSLTSINIPNSVTSIGSDAFSGCSSLTSVTIPNSVMSIRNRAFYECSSLTSITIPNSVTSIGNYAFWNCSSLTSITIPNSVTSIGDYAFYYCSSLTSITIPNSVTSIGDYAFWGCSSLTSITIPNSVTSIGAWAFSVCSSLTSITIPNSVTSIGNYAFRYCSSLKAITCEATTPPTLGGSYVFTSSPTCYIPCGTLAAYKASDWAQYVGEFVEENCVDPTWQILYTSIDSTVVTPYKTDVFGANIVSNTYQDGQGVITFDGPVTSIGGAAFDGCSSLTSITIPNSVTSIGDFAFYYCKSLTSITIPNSVTSIGESAFSACSSLTSVTIGNSVTSIGESAFYACYSLVTVTLPNSVTSIGDGAFNDCRSLTSVTIGNSVTSIGHAAFYRCSSLTSITIPNSVTSIGNEPFRFCSRLTLINVDKNNPNYCSIDGVLFNKDKTTLIQYPIGNTRTEYTIPNSVTSIGYAAFAYCSSLTSITIPNSVTNIGEYAFYDCSSLTSVTIGNSVTSIGNYAFEDCSSLKAITCEAITPPALGSDVFPSNLTTAYIPCYTLAAYEASDWASQVGGFVEDCPPVQKCGDNLYWSFADSTLTITGYGEMYDTEGYGKGIPWYNLREKIAYVNLPNGITSIGSWAFYESKLRTIDIPNGVTHINERAFLGCNDLESLSLPASIDSLGYLVFTGHNELKSINVDGNNNLFDTRDNCNAIIETSTNTLLYGCASTIIPSTVEKIGYGAFNNLYNLKSIVVPNNVKVIDDFAFYWCKLDFIVLPEGLIEIGDYAFYWSGTHESIVIPNSVETIGKYAFANLPHNTSITVGSGVTTIGDSAFCRVVDTVYFKALNPPTINVCPFDGTPSAPICFIPCGTLDAYQSSAWAEYVSEFIEEGCPTVQKCGDDLYWEYADGVLTITGTGDMYDYAKDTDVPWYDVRGNIKTVSLPDAMTKIGDYAFYKCTALTSVTLPEQLKHIGNRAFAQDTKIAGNIVIPEGVNYIEERAFFNLTGVSQFQVLATTPPTLESTNVFTNVNAPIVIPCGYGLVYRKANIWKDLNLSTCEVLIDNLYYMPVGDNEAHIIGYDNKPAGTLTIPGSVVIGSKTRTVTTLADSLFFDCKEISSVIFNEGLESIGERALVRCGLTGTIVLPSTLTTIGERAFSYCDNLEKYILQAMTPPALANDVFTGSNSKALFYISCEAMDDYKVATNWSSLKSRLRDACLNIYHYNTPLGTNGVYTTEDTLVASIYYRRQFTPYRWETLYLPFEVDRVTVLEDGEEFDLRPWNIITGGDYYLAKPDGMLNLEILFDFTDELESHTPYIIQFVYDYYRDKIITFYGKESWHKLSTSFEVLSSSAWMQIAGNTTMQDQLLEKPVYMLRSGLDFILQKTTTTLHPFECYVMPYTAQSGAPARMNVRLRDDVPTAVESVKGNESHLTYSVDGYTLTVYPQGQAFSIYSLNGALIYSCEAGKEAVDCELNSGCYLLHAGTEAHKIML